MQAADRQGLTIKDMVAMAAVYGYQLTEQQVRDKSGIERFKLPLPPVRTGGRPATRFHPEALSHVVGVDLVKLPEPTVRKARNDCGQTRRCSGDTWNVVVDLIKGIYLYDAQKNIRGACHEAIQQLTAKGLAGSITAQYAYDRLMKKRRDHDGNYLSEYRREAWEVTHDDIHQKHKVAKTFSAHSYDYPAIFESLGLAGEGFGAFAVWTIDGRRADTFTLDANGNKVFPYMIVIRDGLTCFPKWVEEVESESIESVTRALWKCMLYWKRVPELAVALDNGIARAIKNIGVLKAMLPPEASVIAQKYKELFGGKAIMRNPSNIPCTPFKAALERSFKQWKDEHDATHFPESYQGGNRFESVHLAISETPIVTALTPSTDAYFESLKRYLYGGFITKSRPDQFPALVKKGIEPTILNAFAYYGGLEKREVLPTGDRIALLLYWSTDRKSFRKAEDHLIESQIDGDYWPVTYPATDKSYHGEMMCVVPFSEHEAFVFHAFDKNNPKYVGIGLRTHYPNYESMVRNKPLVNAMQAEHRRLRHERAKAAPQYPWRSPEPAVPIPSLPGGLPLLEAATLPEETVTAEEVPFEIDDVDETAEILNDSLRLLR